MSDRREWLRERLQRRFWVVVGCIAVLGLVGRLWNIDFDQRQHLHPDERHWALTADALNRAEPPAPHGTIAGPLLDWLDGQRSPANPYRATPSFLYGPVTLAAAKATASWLHEGVVDGDQPAAFVASTLNDLGIPLIDTNGQPRFDDGYGVDLVGRLLDALIDTITILVIAAIGRRLGGRLAGVAAAVLYAGSVLAIQLAHFLGSEPLLGLGCGLTVLGMLRLDRSPDARSSARSGAALGVAAGLAMAAKLTAVGLVVVPFAGMVALVARHRRASDLARLAAAAVAAAITFRFLNPAAFNGLGVTLSKPFLDDVELARTLADSAQPPAFQWANRIPVLQPIAWLGIFTIGPGATIAAVAGAIALVRRRGLRSIIGHWPALMTLAAVAAPFCYIAVTSLPTGRYYVPMLPAFYALAGVGIAAIAHRAVRSSGRPRLVAGSVAALSVGLAAIWGAGFVNGIYDNTNTRIDASRWIEANVPAGSVISSQAWDDGLPLRLPGLDAEAFGSVQLDMVGPDDVAKVERIADQLAEIDYVIESSPRIWNTVTRLPARFPSSINFFEGLDNGTLGFERAATFTRGIGFGSWQLDDSSADEAFSVYDHPEVRIWRKVRTVSRDDIVGVLDPIAASNALPINPVDGHANGLLLYDDEVATNAHGPTYNEAFDTTGSNALHTVGWFLLLELLGGCAFVLFLPLFKRLPDAALGASKIVALGTLAFVLFVAAAWLDVPLDRWLIISVVAAFVAIGGFTGWRRRAELAAIWRDRRGVLITAEVAGAVVFALGVLLRSLNPDLWHPSRGGEKPFEQAFLTAVLRTRTLPVYDPWFSGGSMNYYYGGWFLLAAPARVLKTAPSLVMNLGIAIFGSCSAGAAFTAAGAAFRGRVRHRRAMVAGVLAIAGVLALSNVGVIRAAWRYFVDPSNRTFDWWGLSRIIPRSVAITEFPSWSVLFGDLHPHFMAIGVLLTTVVCAVALRERLVAGQRAAAIILAGLGGMFAGLVRASNTWDVPLALAVVAVAILLALAGRAPWRLCLAAGSVSAAVFLIGWAPYTWRGMVSDAGFDPAFLRTPFVNWLEQFGVFALASLVCVVPHVGRAWRESPAVWRRVSNVHLAAAGLVLLTLGYAAVRPGRVVFICCVALAAGCAWCAWRQRPSVHGDVFIGPLLLAAGWTVQAGVEMLTVRNDGGRMNTVFKFWYESWVVLAAGSAIVIAAALSRSWRGRAAVAVVAAATVVSVAFWWLSLPPRLEDRTSDGGLSLAGEAYLTPDFVFGAGDDAFVPADDMPLVEWLRDNVGGIHVVAEAPGRDYFWTGRVTWLTGLPTPIGWPYHETQQRRAYGAAIETRSTDMAALYATTDEQAIAGVLARYSIEYVVYGTQERLIATPASAATLRSFECLDIAMHGTAANDDFFVAAVNQTCLSGLLDRGR